MSRTIIQSVFRETLGISEPVNWDSLRYQEVDGWDSVGHMALVAELEDHFGLMIETDDIIDMSSFALALEILARYGVDIV